MWVWQNILPLPPPEGDTLRKRFIAQLSPSGGGRGRTFGQTHIDTWTRDNINYTDKPKKHPNPCQIAHKQLSLYPHGAPPSGGWGVGGRGFLRIESNQAQQVVLYTTTGMVVRTIALTEGTNYVNGLQPGVYIIGGKKAVVL